MLRMLVTFIAFTALSMAYALPSGQFENRRETVAAAPYREVKYCNFDQDDCSLNLAGQTSSPDFSITDKLVVAGGPTFTDYSSITEMTANGFPCNVPFTHELVQHQFCTESYECMTNNGMSKCQEGRFLSAILRDRSNDTILNLALPFSGTINANTYVLTFYAFMHCDNIAESCFESDDQLIITIYQDLYEEQSITVKYSNLQTKWNTFAIRLGNVYRESRIIMRFKRDPNWLKSHNTYYGIDEIKLRYSQTDPAIVSKCDFDENHCTVNWAYVNSSDTKLTNMLVTKNKTFTDVSSTTLRAKNGDYCMIPFVYEGKTYYGCTEKYECATPSGMAECAEGRFLQGTLRNSKNDVRVSFKNVFSTNYRGSFRVTFDYFLYCDGSCQISSDYFYAEVGYDTNKGTPVKYPFEVYTTKNGWTSGVISVTTQRDYKLSLNFHIYRILNANNNTSYFGIDNIKVTYLSALVLETTTTKPGITTTSGCKSTPGVGLLTTVLMLILSFTLGR